MNEGIRMGRFLVCMILFITVAGCVSLSYKDASGKHFAYSRWGTQSIKGLAVNEVGNSINISFESSQSDTSNLASTVQVLANKIR